MNWLRKAGAGGIGSMHLEILSLRAWRRMHEGLREGCGLIRARCPRESAGGKIDENVPLRMGFNTALVAQTDCPHSEYTNFRMLAVVFSGHEDC
jgi:hypothetical protein